MDQEKLLADGTTSGRSNMQHDDGHGQADKLLFEIVGTIVANMGVTLMAAMVAVIVLGVTVLVAIDIQV